MKKTIAISLFLIAFISICFSACSKPPSLDVYLSELRSDVFEGQSQSYFLKAGFGFKETPFVNDGLVGETVSQMTFKLEGDLVDGAKYSLSFNNGEELVKTDFTVNPVTHSMTACVETPCFTLKEFCVDVISSGKTEKVSLKSTLPDNTLSSSDALKALYEKQTQLINSFFDENKNLKAELYMRVLVKDEKPFWYVGIASGNEQLKALLVDGISGEVLAIREIF